MSGAALRGSVFARQSYGSCGSQYRYFKSRSMRAAWEATAQEAHGRRYPSFPALSKLLGERRQGELTVVLGAAGIGKSTLLSQLCLDVAMFSDPVVKAYWACYETLPDNLTRTMKRQLLKLDPHEDIDLDSLPLEFVQCPQRNSNVFSVTETLRKKAEENNPSDGTPMPKHFIFDSMQAMASVQKTEPYKLFNVIRELADEREVHVTAIVHPNELTEAGERITRTRLPSLRYFTESDNVLILNRAQDQPDVFNPAKKVKMFDLEVARCRQTLAHGHVQLAYDEDTATFQEIEKYSANDDSDAAW